MMVAVVCLAWLDMGHLAGLAGRSGPDCSIEGYRGALWRYWTNFTAHDEAGERRLISLRDPDDDLVLETAINGSADVIATFNLRDMTAGAAAFGIQVERPTMVLRRIRR